MLKVHSFQDTFSEVIIPTPVPAHIRLPEYYTADQSRPPAPNFANYPIRVDRNTIYDPKNDPHFPILTERFFKITIYYLTKKETELKRLQTSILELKFEVKVKFQGLNPHQDFMLQKENTKPLLLLSKLYILILKEILNFLI